MANKVVQLVDKNSNNLYPIAGSVITDAVSTTAISNQAVTNPKIENGAVNGVANDATAIGTAKLALDTVGTPNLRDASVTSDKMDWATLCPGEVIESYGQITSSTTITPSQNGFLVGKLRVWRTNNYAYGGAYITDDNGVILAGVTYLDIGKGRNNAEFQQAIVLPVLKGVQYRVEVSNLGDFQWLDLRAPRG